MSILLYFLKTNTFLVYSMHNFYNSLLTTKRTCYISANTYIASVKKFKAIKIIGLLNLNLYYLNIKKNLIAYTSMFDLDEHNFLLKIIFVILAYTRTVTRKISTTVEVHKTQTVFSSR